MKRRIHLICNAHLDPVWLWEWQEGAAEAISTFRVAAEMCEKDGGFVFNHNEVILYEWVREYEPDLFERIKKLVKKGRWHIMGGWYFQASPRHRDSTLNNAQFGRYSLTAPLVRRKCAQSYIDRHRSIVEESTLNNGFLKRNRRFC